MRRGAGGRHQLRAGLPPRRRAASRRLAHRSRRAVRRQQARAGHAGEPRRRTRPRRRRRAPVQPHRPAPVRRFRRVERRAPDRAHRSAERCRRSCRSATSAPSAISPTCATSCARTIGDGRAGRAWRLLQRLLGSRRADRRSGARPGRAEPRADSGSSSIRRASVPSTCRSWSDPRTSCGARPGGARDSPRPHARRPARLVARAGRVTAESDPTVAISLDSRSASATIGEQKAKHGPAWPVPARLAQADDARHRRRRPHGRHRRRCPTPTRARITRPTRKSVPFGAQPRQGHAVQVDAEPLSRVHPRLPLLLCPPLSRAVRDGRRRRLRVGHPGEDELSRGACAGAGAALVGARAGGHRHGDRSLSAHRRRVPADAPGAGTPCRPRARRSGWSRRARWSCATSTSCRR